MSEREEYGLQFRFDFDRFFRLGVGFRFRRLSENGLIIPEDGQGEDGHDDSPSPAREEYCVCCPDGGLDCRYPYDCRGPFFSPLLSAHGLIAFSGADVQIDRMRMTCPEAASRDSFPSNMEMPQADALRRIFPRLVTEQLRDMGSPRR
jgi:hypothetical protein